MTELLADTPQAAKARAARQAAERARAYRERAAKAAAVEETIIDTLATLLRETKGPAPTSDTAVALFRGAVGSLTARGWERYEAKVAVATRLGLRPPGLPASSGQGSLSSGSACGSE
jgi:hypothetical protein